MQVALAWLLHRSPNILLIPGTSSVEHLRENLKAAEVKLPAKVVAELNAIGKERDAGDARAGALMSEQQGKRKTWKITTEDTEKGLRSRRVDALALAAALGSLPVNWRLSLDLKGNKQAN